MRAPAPPYRGEGPHRLWHVSEDPAIGRFVPHRAATAQTDDALVWAVDTRHLPLYWFPRDCPRCTFWAGPQSTAADVARLLGGDRSARIHVIEDRWRERVATTELQLYRLPSATFTETPESAGFWVSRQPVEALARITIGDLVARHAAAGIALRTTDDLWPLWDEVVGSTLEFSGMRLRNAVPRP